MDNTIRLQNNYQDSGVIPLTSSNVVGRFRTWRFNEIRSNTGERLKDNYLKITFTFTPREDNDTLVLNDIITTYATTAPY
jgi:hypothetical protein